jgi:hypothetical protein
MRARRVLLVLAFSCIAGACATAPQTYSVASTKTINDSYDHVWSGLVSFFTAGSIPLKTIEKDSGVIYAEGLSFTNEEADCGKPGILVPVGRRMDLNVFVNQPHPGWVEVRVTTTFREIRRFDVSLFEVRCNSKGVVESAILDPL